MIHTAIQLKDKIKNLSGGDNEKAKFLIRNFMMERFLERVSLSRYRRNFILKGGMLVASLVGVDMRATMDIDTTIRALPLNEQDAENFIKEICEISIGDRISFNVTSVKRIMEAFDYPGMRIMLEGRLDRLRQSIKIDISTDDAITPSAMEYEYKLMFENRTIPLISYNLETLLAEKMQTIFARSIANTRLRDFYDIYELVEKYGQSINLKIMNEAFINTCSRRGTIFSYEDMASILADIKQDTGMESMWNRYASKNYYVGELAWPEVLEQVEQLFSKIFLGMDEAVAHFKAGKVSEPIDLSEFQE